MGSISGMKQKSQRQKHYASLNICKKKLGWDDDHYRGFFLKAHGAQMKDGIYKASTMNDLQLAKAASAIHRLEKANNISDWRDGLIAKITAIWCAMADVGVIKNRSRIAMEKFCIKQIRSSKLEWATAQELNQVIETLKKWARREGVTLKH